MKNLSQRVMILFSMVTVALISKGTPSKVYRVVMVISGSPTSKGTPIGIDFTASTIEDVIRIVLH